jgi:hypothetical protein
VAGSYIAITEGDGDGSDADSFDDDILAPWQGFFVEREAPSADSDNNGGPSSLTFDVADRTDGPDRIIGARATTGAHEAGRVGFELRVHNSNGNLLARDQAARLTLRSTASLGYDAWDATKLTPLASSFATVSIRGTGPDGTPLRKAAEGLPFDLDENVELPLDIAAQNVEGTATLNVAAWEGVPEAWTLHLVDTRGTADPSDDREHELSPGADPYSFPVGPDVAGVASIRHEASKAALTANRTSAGRPAPRVEPLDTALRSARQASTPDAAKPGGNGQEAAEQETAEQEASADAPSRLYLRIIPSTDPLPVELAGMNATVDGDAVQLEWQTASETNNAGFHVEHQAMALGDSTATPSPAGWVRIGFVEGAGTTSEAQSYRFRTRNDLGYGRHVFRLRQVDLDGTETTTEPVEVHMRLEEAYAVDAPYPNPAQQQAVLPITVREDQRVTVEVYDLLGRRVAVVRNRALRGQHTERVTLRTGRLSSGVYFVRVRGDRFATTRRLTVVR